MLRMLSGNTHMVYTGVAVIDAETKKTLVHFAEGTEVTMYPMTEQWIRSYVASGEPMDKAGAYAIQGGCMPFIREIRGEYTNVVGLSGGPLLSGAFAAGNRSAGAGRGG